MEHSTEEIARYRHGRVPRAVRERQILAIAEELFAERGYEGASMDEVARRAGVTKPVVYGTVGSKEELFRRCFERAGDELAASIGEAAAHHLGDVEGLLRASTLAFLEFIDDHDRAWAMLYSLDMGGRAAAHVQEIRLRQARTAAALLAGQTSGIDERRLEVVAFVLNGAVEALGHWRREHPDSAAEDLTDWLVALILPGLRELVGR
jgi:AcrR family transcriptional regulator